MNNNFSEQLMECFYNTGHAGVMDLNADHVSAYTEKSASSGEQVTFYLSAGIDKYNKSNDNNLINQIQKISFTAYGGPVIIAAAEYVARFIAAKIASQDAVYNLDKINEQSLLVFFKLDKTWQPSLSLVCRAFKSALKCL